MKDKKTLESTITIKRWPTWNDLVAWALFDAIQNGLISPGNPSLSPDTIKNVLEGIQNSSPISLHTKLYAEYEGFANKFLQHDYKLHLNLPNYEKE